jgi:hypothetical protein
MNSSNKTTKFSVTSYDRTTTVEVDHLDVDMEEFLDIVKVLAIGMTFHEDTFKRSIIELGEMYKEEMEEKEDKWFSGIDEAQIDAAFAEHNALEEEDWTEELEEQYWKEQCPDPFLTPEELAALPTECWCGSRERCDCVSEPNDNDEYNDYGERVTKVEKVQKKKKKDAKRK